MQPKCVASWSSLVTNNTRSPAVARIADLTDRQWRRSRTIVSRTFTFLIGCSTDYFYLIPKGVCDFLLVINSNLGPISHPLVTIARTEIQGHPRSVISCHLKAKMSVLISDWLIVTLALSLTVSELWLLTLYSIAWNFSLKIAAADGDIVTTDNKLNHYLSTITITIVVVSVMLTEELITVLVE